MEMPHRYEDQGRGERLTTSSLRLLAPCRERRSSRTGWRSRLTKGIEANLHLRGFNSTHEMLRNG